MSVCICAYLENYLSDWPHIFIPMRGFPIGSVLFKDSLDPNHKSRIIWYVFSTTCRRDFVHYRAPLVNKNTRTLDNLLNFASKIPDCRNFGLYVKISESVKSRLL